jgi:hypothetical protein
LEDVTVTEPLLEEMAPPSPPSVAEQSEKLEDVTVTEPLVEEMAPPLPPITPFRIERPSTARL